MAAVPENANSFQPLALAEVVRRCAQETELFFQRRSYDSRYCYELFRRAVFERNEHAWERIYAQYRSLVGSWVTRHTSFHQTGEEVDFFINRAFEKLWSALTPDRFEQFPDLKSLLRYLQMCVHSTIIDFTRSMEGSQVVHFDDHPGLEKQAQDVTFDEMAAKRLDRKGLWDMLLARVKDEQERAVLHDSFVLDLKPRELYARHSKLFASVDEVYRVKENLLARLRRDTEVQAFFLADVEK